MNFCEKLKELRKENHYTQKQVADKLKVSVNCYGGYEQGYRRPDYETLVEICKIFAVSADYLLGLEDETGAKLYSKQVDNL